MSPLAFAPYDRERLELATAITVARVLVHRVPLRAVLAGAGETLDHS
ncbi:hypothetical protein OG462_41135 [Streptomyces sp. NBC_01077]|nr:hypothetical protein OG462_41135 [Streptomyces sp. NBC_01077]